MPPNQCPPTDKAPPQRVPLHIHVGLITLEVMTLMRLSEVDEHCFTLFLHFLRQVNISADRLLEHKVNLEEADRVALDIQRLIRERSMSDPNLLEPTIVEFILAMRFTRNTIRKDLAEYRKANPGSFSNPNKRRKWSTQVDPNAETTFVTGQYKEAFISTDWGYPKHFEDMNVDEKKARVFFVDNLVCFILEQEGYGEVPLEFRKMYAFMICEIIKHGLQYAETLKRNLKFTAMERVEAAFKDVKTAAQRVVQRMYLQEIQADAGVMQSTSEADKAQKRNQTGGATAARPEDSAQSDALERHRREVSDDLKVARFLWEVKETHERNQIVRKAPSQLERTNSFEEIPQEPRSNVPPAAHVRPHSHNSGSVPSFPHHEPALQGSLNNLVSPAEGIKQGSKSHELDTKLEDDLAITSKVPRNPESSDSEDMPTWKRQGFKSGKEAWEWRMADYISSSDEEDPQVTKDYSFVSIPDFPEPPTGVSDDSTSETIPAGSSEPLAGFNSASGNDPSTAARRLKLEILVKRLETTLEHLERAMAKKREQERKRSEISDEESSGDESSDKSSDEELDPDSNSRACLASPTLISFEPALPPLPEVTFPTLAETFRDTFSTFSAANNLDFLWARASYDVPNRIIRSPAPSFYAPPFPESPTDQRVPNPSVFGPFTLRKYTYLSGRVYSEMVNRETKRYLDHKSEMEKMEKEKAAGTWKEPPQKTEIEDMWVPVVGDEEGERRFAYRKVDPRRWILKDKAAEAYLKKALLRPDKFGVGTRDCRPVLVEVVAWVDEDGEGSGALPVGKFADWFYT